MIHEISYAAKPKEIRSKHHKLRLLTLITSVTKLCDK